jgi:hypothetical protein
MSDPTCVLCPVYRPRAKPRPPVHPPVCDGDRQLLDRHLTELPELHQRLSQPDPPEADEPTYRSPGERGVDPLAPLGGAGPVPGRRQRPRVSGSRETSGSPPLDRIDLTLPARPAARRLFARGALELDGDQIGHLPVATILETWARDWRDTCWPDQQLPAPQGSELVAWLHARLTDACDRHQRIDEFAAEISEVRAAMRRALREPDPLPQTEPYGQLPCPECDLRGLLLRRPEDPYIECGGCGTLHAPEELA